MDFKDKVKVLSDRITQNISKTNTEEATKTAFILPLIQFLGYDIFNPSEVIPEYISDFGTKKGEKVDYAIIINNNPLILIEAKHHTEKLDIHGSQLFRYFSVTKSRFGILTNGIEYEFYTDLEKQNIMDKKPFFKFSILNIHDSDIIELKKFQKENFNLDEILNLASELKYSSLIYETFSREIINPSDEFIKFFIQNCYEGRSTPKMVELFKSLFKKTMNRYISEVISNKLSATIKEPDVNKQEDIEIETTFEEIEAYSIIKSILLGAVDPKRVYYRDSLSYLSVILDDNNKKCICRLYLNGKKKYIRFIDNDKKEIKNSINDVNDIFNFKSEIIDSLNRIESVIA